MHFAIEATVGKHAPVPNVVGIGEPFSIMGANANDNNENKITTKLGRIMKQYPDNSCPKDTRLQRSDNTAIALVRQSASNACPVFSNTDGLTSKVILPHSIRIIFG